MVKIWWKKCFIIFPPNFVPLLVIVWRLNHFLSSINTVAARRGIIANKEKHWASKYPNREQNTKISSGTLLNTIPKQMEKYVKNYLIMVLSILEWQYHAYWSLGGGHLKYCKTAPQVYILEYRILHRFLHVVFTPRS